MGKRWGAAATALVIILAVLLAIYRIGAARVALFAIGSASGYRISVASLHFGAHHGALVGVRVTRGGEPVLRAQRIDLTYDLRDLLPGSRHRFGISSVSIDGPQITVIRHRDGTYNIAVPGAVGSGSAPRQNVNGVPIALTIRIRDASAQVVDRYRYYSSSRLQRVDHVDIDADVDTARATRYVVRGDLQDAGAQPFRLAGTIDYAAGWAVHHVEMRAVPIAAIGNYFINSQAAQILSGSVHDLNFHAWSFDVRPGTAASYTYAGRGMLRDGSMRVSSLDAPILGMNGPITIFDAGFTVNGMRAHVGHIPIVVSGGMFDFSDPQFRLNVLGHGDLRYLKEVAHFANGLPIHGGVAIHALIEGGVSAPVLLIGYRGRRFNYQEVPIDDPHGTVALYQSNLIVLPFHGYYDGIKLHVEGNLQLGDHVRSVLALHAIGSSAHIPYLSALLRPQPVVTEVLLQGQDLRVDARGYLASARDDDAGGFYDIDPNGVGTFGPFSIRTPGGGTLLAGFSLNRLRGESAFWASVRSAHLNQPVQIALPGVQMPLLPPMVASVDRADLAGTGSGSHVVIGGSALLTHAHIAGVPFTRIDAQFAGPFAAARLDRVRASGPWGTFSGSGTFAPDAIAARGFYRGTFAGLRPFLGGFPISGEIAGPVGIAIAQNRIYIQMQDTSLRNGMLHGIPISSVSGTMAYDNGVLRVYAARAQAAGGTITAAGSFETDAGRSGSRLGIATTQLDAGVMHRAFGVPISGGSLRAIGFLSPGAAVPDLDANVWLGNGTAAGYGPFDANAHVSITSGVLHARRALARYGTMVAQLDGEIGGIASGQARYDVHAQVPAGQIGTIPALLGLQPHGIEGSFAADVHVGGSGAAPFVHGNVNVHVGSINGLGFSQASGSIAVHPGGFALRHGRVDVGSTQLQFSAAQAPAQFAFSLQSAHADLTDFNDYFDTGDTLAGKGSMQLAFSHAQSLTFTTGRIDIAGLRYRRLPIGDTQAQWAGFRNVVQGQVRIGGSQGELQASGTIALAPSSQLARIIKGSRYDLNGELRNFDLTTWLPALGFPQVPLTGRIDGKARVRGAYPHLQIAGDAAIRNGTIGPLPIEQGTITARSASGDRIDLTSAHLILPGLQADAAGSIGLSPDAPMDLTVHATSSDLPRLIAQISKRRVSLRGTFESTLTLRGTLRAPAVSAGVDGSDVNAFGLSIPAFAGELQLQRRNLLVRNFEVTFANGRASLAGSLPLQLRPFGVGPLNAPIDMDLAADGVDLSAFDALAGNGTQLGGTLSGHVGISGSVRDPRIFGTLAASDASYVSALETVPIAHTVAQIVFTGTHARLEHAHAQLGSGTVGASGELNFGGGLQGGPLGYRIAIDARGAQLDLPQFGSGTFDATVALRRAAGKLGQLSGRVAIHDAELPFNSFLKFGGAAGSGGGSPPFDLGFDLTIAAGRNVRVRGGGVGLFGLDISGTGSAHLAGTLTHPTMSGQFDSTGGTLTYIDHLFRIETGQVTFDPADGVLPNVYAIAVAHVTNPDPDPIRNPTGSATITAQVNGSVASPKVTFSSVPSGYTDQQIIAMLLPLGGLVGPIQFTDTGVVLPAGQLSGAPPLGTGALLPSILVRRENGTLTVGQEAFNVLNAQLASSLLGPVETALGSTLGLSDVNLVVDDTGNVGVNVRRLLGADFYAIYGTTFGIPVRQTFGFDWQPNAFSSAQFTMFVQQGPTPLFLSPDQTLSNNPRASAGQAVLGSNGFTFLYQRLF